MKRLQLAILLALFSFGSLFAQTSLLANYPLVSDAADATGNNDDILLRNAPFENGGVYSNGIYYNSDTSGSDIISPLINDFNFDDFTLKLEFRVAEYPEFSKPVFIGGMLWRWIGVYLDEQGRLALMANDHGDFFQTNTVAGLDSWHSVTLTYNRPLKQLSLYFNGNLLIEELMPLLEHNNDSRFLNAHAGIGFTFKGYWRNLKIYNAAIPSGIGENNGLTGIDVAVTPEDLRIVIPQHETGVVMQLINMSGSELSRQTLTAGTNSISTTLLDSGSYLLVFTNKDGRKAVEKIIIM
ncbi:MAG: T9SS type A sorting domain-containing protein [Bacteroidales bacterium]|nr:T9SS type A sorting domain-containing protein [Bacteroidales bacterium]